MTRRTDGWVLVDMVLPPGRKHADRGVDGSIAGAWDQPMEVAAHDSRGALILALLLADVAPGAAGGERRACTATLGPAADRRITATASMWTESGHQIKSPSGRAPVTQDRRTQPSVRRHPGGRDASASPGASRWTTRRPSPRPFQRSAVLDQDYCIGGPFQRVLGVDDGLDLGGLDQVAELVECRGVLSGTAYERMRCLPTRLSRAPGAMPPSGPSHRPPSP